jgi:hypothetical protein
MAIVRIGVIVWKFQPSLWEIADPASLQPHGRVVGKPDK